MKKTLSLDFDGVCHQYITSWSGPEIIHDPPVRGLFEFLLAVHPYFTIEIYSTRSETDGGRKAMRNWFYKWGVEWSKGNPDAEDDISDVLSALRFPSSKPKAFVGLDDRILTFEGLWPEVSTLLNWKPWNKRDGFLPEREPIALQDVRNTLSRAAAIWLDFTREYPIEWEGGVDGAMRAACEEIKKLRKTGG